MRFLAFLVSLLFFSSCASQCEKKKNLGDKGDKEIIISGVVKDIRSKPLISSKVKVYSTEIKETQTDEFGVFHTAIKLSEKIKIEVQDKIGKTVKILRPQNEENIFVDILVNPSIKISSQDFRIENGFRTIEKRDFGLKLKTEDDFDLGVILGEPRGLFSFPGDFKAEDISLVSSVAELRTIGWIDLTFDKPIVNPKNPAFLIRRIPETEQKETIYFMKRGERTIPFYYLDEEKGIWIREGDANIFLSLEDVDGDGKLEEVAYAETPITHTSWYNLDIPLPPGEICIQGKVVDEKGNPLPDFYVIAYSSSNYSYSRADDNGFFSIYLPQCKRLTCAEWGTRCFDIIGYCSQYCVRYSDCQDFWKYKIFATDKISLSNIQFIEEKSRVQEIDTSKLEKGKCYPIYLPPPKVYSVECSVRDDLGNPITAFVVSSDGKSAIANGIFTFFLPPGEYVFTASTTYNNINYSTQKSISVYGDTKCEIIIPLSPIKLNCSAFINLKPFEGVEIFAKGNRGKTGPDGITQILVPRPLSEEDIEVLAVSPFGDNEKQIIKVNPSSKEVQCRFDFEYKKGCIRGKVKDKNKKGVEKVMVSIGDEIKYTDENGFFEFENFLVKKKDGWKVELDVVYETPFTRETYKKEYFVEEGKCIWSEVEIDTRPAWVIGIVQTKRGRHISGARVEHNFGDVDFTGEGGQFKLRAPANTPIRVKASYNGFEKEVEVQTKEKGSTESVFITLDIEDAPPLVKLDGRIRGNKAFITAEVFDDYDFIDYEAYIDGIFYERGNMEIKNGKGEKKFQITVEKDFITFKFVAKDSLGNSDFAEIIVKEQTPEILRIDVLGDEVVGETITAVAILKNYDDDLTISWIILKDGVSYPWITTKTNYSAEVNIPENAGGGEYVIKAILGETTKDRKILISKRYKDGEILCEPKPEVCDGIDNDCNGLVDDGAGSIFYRDFDNDGYGSPQEITLSCTQPLGYVSNGLDCDDGKPEINPQTLWFKDSDDDGYTDGVSYVGCERKDGFKLSFEVSKGDCNDDNSQINPSVVEFCDDIDNNCNGEVDEGLKRIFYLDADGDGYGSVVSHTACTLPVGYVSNSSDCNDNNPQINPSVAEVCDGVDNNCNGQVDEGVKIVFYKDADNDGYTDGVTSLQCFPTSPFSLTHITLLDCDDFDRTKYPGATTTVCDGKDNNCNGQIDESDEGVANCSVCPNYAYRDADGDGFGSSITQTYLNPPTCTVMPPGTTTISGDCDDNNAQINPSTYWYRDFDGDGYPASQTSYPDAITQSCERPTGYKLESEVILSPDCNDDNSQIKPSASEICNGIDDNCSFGVDEGFPPCNSPSSLTYFYVSSISVGISWSDNSPNESGFIVEVSFSPDFSSASTLSISQNITQIYVSSLSEKTTYWFRVYAFNSTGTTSYSNSISIKTLSQYFDDAILVSAGGGHTCAIRGDYSLWCWGANFYGQLGDGTTNTVYQPKKIMDGVSKVSTGLYHTCAVKTNGSLWCWGYNSAGQVGDGTYTKRLTPTLIFSSGVSDVSTGWWHTCAVVSGNLYCWGANNYGQLGIGGFGGDRNSPQLVTSVTGITKISLGDVHSLAISSNVWAWGRNFSGQLGDGTNTDRDLPQLLSHSFVEVSAGGDHSCGIKSDNSLWCWGSNFYGQLGNGTFSDSNSPQQVSLQASMVSAGEDHSCAISNGLWCWGRNYYGQLGNGLYGDENNASSPQFITTSISFVSAGNGYTCAISDGLWCWGRNDYGQLGIGSTSSSPYPQRVSGGFVSYAPTGGAPIFFYKEKSASNEKFGCSSSNFSIIVIVVLFLLGYHKVFSSSFLYYRFREIFIRYLSESFYRYFKKF